MNGKMTVALVIVGLAAALSSAEPAPPQDVVVYAAATLILLAPWLLFDSILPQTHENYPARMNIPTFLDNMARLPTVVCLFIGQFLQLFRWSGLWLTRRGCWEWN